jgi:hypothetical protein
MKTIDTGIKTNKDKYIRVIPIVIPKPGITLCCLNLNALFVRFMTSPQLKAVLR